MDRVDQRLFLELLCDTLGRGEAVHIRVRGGSMLPWLREGKKVRVLPIRDRAVSCGDIVLFWRTPGEPVLHRVVRVRLEESTRLVECLGDAEDGDPEVVPWEHVIGQVALAAWSRLIFRMVHPWRRALNRLVSQLRAIVGRRA